MAARKFLTPIDMTGNELQNAVAQLLASAPSTPKTGQYYYNSTTNKFMWRNNAAWIDPLDRTNHTSTQLAATISDFDANVTNKRLDQFAAPTAAVALNGQKITGLADGTNASDAATFGQVQAAVQSRDWKDSVRAATTANITLSGLQTIDGISLAANDRVLVKDQTTASANGLYTAQSGAWVRTTDADTSAKVTANMTVMVEEGTVNGDKIYTLTTNGPITLGTTALTFALTGAGTTYSQGTGISISGSVISIDTAVVTRKFASTIGDGTATSYAVAHGLATLDVQVQVYEIATGATVEVDVVRNSTSQVTCIFATAPAAGTYRVLVQG